MAWVTVNHIAAPVVHLKAEGNTGCNQDNVERKKGNTGSNQDNVDRKKGQYRF